VAKKTKSPIAVEQIDGMIRTIRGTRVILDSDLAKIYGVPTFRFNEAIKRNRHRFPPDFMFQLTTEEAAALRSQIAILKKGRGQHRKYRPYAFTEHGALQAANVRRSPRAVQMNTTCGDAVGWTALSVWETGERLGRARVNVFADFSLSILVRHPCLHQDAPNAARHSRACGETRRAREKAHFPTGRARSRYRWGPTGADADSQSAARDATTAKTAHRIHTLTTAKLLLPTENQ
jgi:ORF6N domain